MKTATLPRGWADGEHSQRRDQIATLPRKVRVLLAAEWARSELDKFETKYPADARPRLAIDAANNFVFADAAKAADAAAEAADAAAYAADAAAYAAANAANAAADAADAAAYAAADAANAAAYAAANAAYAAANAAANAAYAAANAAANAAADAAGKNKWRWLYKTFKNCRGSGLVFDSCWRTTDTLAIAQQIKQSRDFSAMPILADALQDAGCDDYDLLSHLQTETEFTLADWILWNLFDLDDVT